MTADVMSDERVATARLFDPLTTGGIEIRNRLAVAPMTRVSATQERYTTAGSVSFRAKEVPVTRRGGSRIGC